MCSISFKKIFFISIDFFLYSYEPVHAKIERHFQKQNVIREDPQAYKNRFGEQLCDSTAVIQQARAAGVLEDLVKYFLKNFFFSF